MRIPASLFLYDCEDKDTLLENCLKDGLRDYYAF